MGLIGHNKKFLQFNTSASGSIYDAQLLKYSTLFKDIQSGGGIPNKSIILGDFGEIPLRTTGDTDFPLLQWLLKDTRLEKALLQ